MGTAIKRNNHGAIRRRLRTDPAAHPGRDDAPSELESGVITYVEEMPFTSPCKRASNDDPANHQGTDPEVNCTHVPSMRPSYMLPSGASGVGGSSSGGGGGGYASGGGGNNIAGGGTSSNGSSGTRNDAIGMSGSSGISDGATSDQSGSGKTSESSSNANSNNDDTNIRTSISCPLQNGGSDSTGFQFQDDSNEIVVKYAYEVETKNVSNTDSFLPQLEEQLLVELADAMMPCLQQKGRKLNRVGTTNALHRMLQDGECIGVKSSPADAETTEGACTLETREADNCFIIDGGITLVLDSTANETEAQETARSVIRDAMANDMLLSEDSPEVVTVRYLDDSYEEYLSAFTGMESGFTNGAIEEETSSNSKIIATSVSVTLIALFLMLLALLCVKHRRRLRSKVNGGDDGSKESSSKYSGSFYNHRRKQDPDGVHDDDAERDLDVDLDNVLAGIDATNTRKSYCIDPPGSFHLGNHHYTADGVRYHSAQCALCAKSKDDDNAHGLDDQLSFDLDEAKQFTDFNRHELGQAHSSMHVRHCKSTMCDICRNTGGVVFLKSEAKTSHSPPKASLRE